MNINITFASFIKNLMDTQINNCPKGWSDRGDYYNNQREKSII